MITCLASLLIPEGKIREEQNWPAEPNVYWSDHIRVNESSWKQPSSPPRTSLDYLLPSHLLYPDVWLLSNCHFKSLSFRIVCYTGRNDPDIWQQKICFLFIRSTQLQCNASPELLMNTTVFLGGCQLFHW